QVSFLIEARSIAGYSGSPVFWYDKPAERKIDLTKRGFLLGVDWGHVDCAGDIVDIFDKETGRKNPKLEGRYNSGMMGVVPASKLEECLDDPAVVREREEAERAAGEAEK